MTSGPTDQVQWLNAEADYIDRDILANVEQLRVPTVAIDNMAIDTAALGNDTAYTLGKFINACDQLLAAIGSVSGFPRQLREIAKHLTAIKAGGNATMTTNGYDDITLLKFQIDTIANKLIPLRDQLHGFINKLSPMSFPVNAGGAKIVDLVWGATPITNGMDGLDGDPSRMSGVVNTINGYRLAQSMGNLAPKKSVSKFTNTAPFTPLSPTPVGLPALPPVSTVPPSMDPIVAPPPAGASPGAPPSPPPNGGAAPSPAPTPTPTPGVDANVPNGYGLDLSKYGTKSGTSDTNPFLPVTTTGMSTGATIGVIALVGAAVAGTWWWVSSKKTSQARPRRRRTRK